MAQTVELLLDELLDAQVREEWAVLVEAGLPSQARHTGVSNAPHVTLGVADRLLDSMEAALLEIDHGIGSPVELGGFVVFGGSSYVLSRLVVPTMALLTVQQAVRSVIGAEARAWTPHVTLARRLDADQLAAALAALAGRPRELVGDVADVRRWDSERRRTWSVARP